MEQLHFVKHESHRAALTSLLSELRADDDVCGLLVTGSVARGDALPESDVDVVVILRSGTPRHHALEEREGVPIEVSALDEASARSKMEESPSYLYAFLDGRILFDPEGGLKALTESAQAKLAGHRTDQKELDRLSHWLWAASAKLAAASATRNELLAGYMASIASWTVVEGLWAINDLPVPPWGTMWSHLRDLKMVPADLNDWLTKLFSGGTWDRVEAARCLMEWLQPLLPLPSPAGG